MKSFHDKNVVLAYSCSMRYALLVILFLLLGSCTPDLGVSGDFEAGMPLARFEPLGVVNGLYIKAFSSPDEESNLMFVLRGGDIVEMINRSKGRVWLSQELDYWYLVHFEGKSAWVFGTALTLCRTRTSAELASARIQELVFK